MTMKLGLAIGYSGAPLDVPVALAEQLGYDSVWSAEAYGSDAITPGAMEEYGPWLEEGFRRAGNGKSLKDFTIQASVRSRSRQTS
jgi:alkanesulfonate monooxygenase SsuD/methylene tetrahydromethanopterin reductase-like flavin-dependent oxidoreductase (luciferase family)